VEGDVPPFLAPVAEPPLSIAQAPPTAPKLELAADQTITEAARQAIIFGGIALERHREAAAAGQSEPIHQLRVTARRLRASLHLFAGVIHATYSRIIERDLIWMAQAAGGAREREISAAIFRKRSAKLDPVLADSLAAIYTTLLRERSLKLYDLQSVVESKRYRTLLARLENPRLRKVRAHTVLSAEAASMLRPIARSVARAGAALDEGSTPRTIHRLRVRVKRLRYALELLSALGGKRSRRLLSRLEVLQELLGNLNDLSVATAWLINFPRTAGTELGAVMAAGAMAQALRSRSAKLARRSVKAWRKLDKSTAIADALDEIRRHGKTIPVQASPIQELATENAA
jgi:CHAD domain-containing protein